MTNLGIFKKKKKSDRFWKKKNKLHKNFREIKKNLENFKKFSAQFYERFLKNQNPHQTIRPFPTSDPLIGV